MLVEERIPVGAATEAGALSSSNNLPTPPRAIPPRGGHINGEGPMTPRNDAGPFVLDGGAGRTAGRTATPAS